MRLAWRCNGLSGCGQAHLQCIVGQESKSLVRHRCGEGRLAAAGRPNEGDGVFVHFDGARVQHRGPLSIENERQDLVQEMPEGCFRHVAGGVAVHPTAVCTDPEVSEVREAQHVGVAIAMERDPVFSGRKLPAVISRWVRRRQHSIPALRVADMATPDERCLSLQAAARSR